MIKDKPSRLEKPQRLENGAVRWAHSSAAQNWIKARAAKRTIKRFISLDDLG
jgi:hypothetical protein